MSNKLFVSNRDIIVRSSKTGHAIAFYKDVPQGVPEVMHSEVAAKGILPVDNEGKVDTKFEQSEERPAPRLSPEDPAERTKQILAVIKAIVKRNNPADFAGGGHPSAVSVTASVGWAVDQKEVRGIWEKNRQEILGAKHAE